MDPSGDRSRRIPQLDGLRGIAVAMVLVYHYGAHIRGFLPPGLTLAWSGVDLFFVLSGFLIGGILLDARESPNYFRVFYRRRACRIFPIYFVFLGAFFLAARLSHSPDGQHLFHPLIPWQACVAFVQNFWMAIHRSEGAYALTPTWSLAVEEQFYLTLPAVVRFVRPERLPWVLLGGIVAAPLIRLGIFLANPQFTLAIAYLLPCRMDSLLFGVAAAYFLRRPGAWDYLRAHRRSLWTIVEVLSVLCAVFFLRPNMTDAPMMLAGFDCLGLLYTAVLAVVLVDDRVAKVLSARWLMGLGTISYGVYVIHQLVFGITSLELGGSRRSWELVEIVALLATLGVAKLSWEYFEKPWVQFGHRERYLSKGGNAGGGPR